MSSLPWPAAGAAQAAAAAASLYAASTVARLPRPRLSYLLLAIASGLLGALISPAWAAGAVEVAAVTVLLRFGQQARVRPALLLSFFMVADACFWTFICWLMLPPALHLLAPAFPCTVLILLTVVFARFPAYAERTAQAAAVAAALAGIIVLPLAWQHAGTLIPENVWTDWLVLDVVLAAIVLIGRSQRRYTIAQELADRTQAEREAAERHYRDLESVIQANSTLYHDMRHHLTALNRMLTTGDTAVALAYVRELQSEPSGALQIQSGDYVLDGLIAAKLDAAAKQAEITVDCSLPSVHEIRAADLAAVVGNVLDNAVEAAMSSGAARPVIELLVRPVGSMLFIRTRNSCSSAPHNPEDKQQLGSLHGWGLRSVRNIAERYDGAVEIWQQEDNECCVAVSLRYLSFETPKTERPL